MDKKELPDNTKIIKMTDHQFEMYKKRHKGPKKTEPENLFEKKKKARKKALKSKKKNRRKR